MNVIVLTKSFITDRNSYLAQGGATAAIGEKDYPHKHFIETLEAGRFHHDRDAVLTLTEDALLSFSNFIRKVAHLIQMIRAIFHLEWKEHIVKKRIVHGGGDATAKNIIE